VIVFSPLPGDSSPGKRKSNEREKEDVIVFSPLPGDSSPGMKEIMNHQIISHE